MNEIEEKPKEQIRVIEEKPKEQIRVMVMCTCTQCGNTHAKKRQRRKTI